MAKNKIFLLLGFFLFFFFSASAIFAAIREITNDARPATCYVADGTTMLSVPAATEHSAIFSVTMTSADTEYTVTLSDYTGTATAKKLYFFCEDGTAFRFAYSASLVATPTGAYIPVPANAVVDPGAINWPATKKIYFGCDSAGKVIRGEVGY